MMVSGIGEVSTVAKQSANYVEGHGCRPDHVGAARLGAGVRKPNKKYRTVRQHSPVMDGPHPRVNLKLLRGIRMRDTHTAVDRPPASC
jgi:hypothetical protein